MQLIPSNDIPLKKILVKISLVFNPLFLYKKKVNKTPLPIDMGTKKTKSTVLINGLKKNILFSSIYFFKSKTNWIH